MLVQSGLERNRLSKPGKIALVVGERRLTYAELDDAANRLANALVAAGVKRGDRVAVYLPNTVEAVVAIFAALKADGVFVVLNRSTKLDKLSYEIADSGAVVLISEPGIPLSDLWTELQARNANVRRIILTGPARDISIENGAVLGLDAILRDYPSARPQTRNIDLDLACLVYTSGSSGRPKGVMCGHSNIVFAVNSITTYLENVESDIVLNVLPLSFDYGLYQALMTLTFGGTLVLEQSFAFPVRILQRIEEEHVTGFPGVPTVFATLLNMDLSEFDLSSLRYLTNTAAALPPSHILSLKEKFPGVTIHSMYGLTETKRTLHLPPDQLERRPGSVGIAIPGTEVWTESADGRRAGANEVGELVVRGRHVMRGYWNSPEATAQRFRPGPIPGEYVCYTGDLFRMDEDGFLYFVARKDDIIKTRGEKVSPREVEDVLHSIPGVFEAAVVGVEDPILGQAIKAVLVADTSHVTQKSVLAYCRAHLEEFMVPKEVSFCESLPKTASGKVHKLAIAG